MSCQKVQKGMLSDLVLVSNAISSEIWKPNEHKKWSEMGLHFEVEWGEGIFFKIFLFTHLHSFVSR